MKPLIIYHAKCADGSGAAYAAWCKWGDGAEYRPASYSDALPADEDVRGRDLFVLDFSYPHDALRRLGVACELMVIDHHKTFGDAVHDAYTVRKETPTFEYVYDAEKSGAVLAWEHFHRVLRVPEVLLYVQDRDLWKWELPGSREVSAALASRGVIEDGGFRALDEVHAGGAEMIETLQREGEILLRGRERKLVGLAAIAERVRLPVDSCRRCGATRPDEGTVTNSCVLGTDAEGNLRSDHVFSIDCQAVNSPRTQSELGGYLAEAAEKRGEPALGIVWFRDGARGIFRVSLRSRGDLDASAIAKRWLGGGGHRNAAGFECDELPWVVLGPGISK